MSDDDYDTYSLSPISCEEAGCTAPAVRCIVDYDSCYHFCTEHGQKQCDAMNKAQREWDEQHARDAD